MMTMDKVLRKPIEAGLIPGVVALAADDRRLIYEGAFGRRAVDKPQPMTVNSVFRIASMTKAITGTVPVQFVEKGRIGLQHPMGDVLPTLATSVKLCFLQGLDAARSKRALDCEGTFLIRGSGAHADRAPASGCWRQPQKRPQSASRSSSCERRGPRCR
jgi:methyl acetate hydrolase